MTVEYSGIRNQFQKCKKEWWNTSKKRSLELLNHFEKQVNKPYSGAQQFISFMNDDYFENLEFFAEETAEKVSEYLAFAFDQKNRLELIESRIKGLQLKYEENQFSGLLSQDNFFDDLTNPKLPYYTYIRIYMDVELEIKEHCENKNSDFSYIFIKPTEEIISLTKVITEVELLKNLHKLFNQDKTKNENLEPNFEENKYPKVFKSAYGYELFRYLVRVDDEKIAPAWGKKYFDLFKDEEKLIKKTAKQVNFIRFIKSEYGIELPELDGRASFNDEAGFLKEIEIDFQTKYNVRRF